MDINVNNIHICYEKIGSGKPLIMLHGNGESSKIFHKAASVLQEDFTVYLPDSRGHGKSQVTNDLSYDNMAEDVFKFIEELGLKKPIICGFSDGAITALLLAINHPEIPGAIIACGANSSPKGLKAPIRFFMKVNLFFTGSDKTKMMLTQPNISGEMLRRVICPTLISCASNDMIKESDSEFIARNIKGSEFSIQKGENHGSYIVNSKKIAKIVTDFCSEKYII